MIIVAFVSWLPELHWYCNSDLEWRLWHCGLGWVKTDKSCGAKSVAWLREETPDEANKRLSPSLLRTRQPRSNQQFHSLLPPSHHLILFSFKPPPKCLQQVSLPPTNPPGEPQVKILRINIKRIVLFLLFSPLRALDMSMDKEEDKDYSREVGLDKQKAKAGPYLYLVWGGLGTFWGNPPAPDRDKSQASIWRKTQTPFLFSSY